MDSVRYVAGMTVLERLAAHPGFLGGHIAIAWAPQTWDAVLASLAANPQANPRQGTSRAA